MKHPYINPIMNRDALICVEREVSANCPRNILRTAHYRIDISEPCIYQIAVKLYEPIAMHVKDNSGLPVYTPNYWCKLREIVKMHYITLVNSKGPCRT
jgi:hypothetical protein